MARARKELGSQRGLERLLFFTDAVVAIAITLLVLPESDTLLAAFLDESQAKRNTTGIAQLLLSDPYFSLLIGIGISFAVIARLWWAHHQMFEHVEGYTGPLAFLNLVWAFTIVFLPLPTSFVALQHTHSASYTGSFLLYVGTMTVSSVVLTAMAGIIHLDARVAEDHGRSTRNRFIGMAATTVGFGLAMVVGSTNPAINYWSLWLIAVISPLETLVRRSFDRRSAGRGASPSTPDRAL